MRISQSLFPCKIDRFVGWQDILIEIRLYPYPHSHLIPYIVVGRSNKRSFIYSRAFRIRFFACVNAVDFTSTTAKKHLGQLEVGG